MGIGVIVAVDPGLASGFAIKIPGVGYRTATFETPEDLWDAVKGSGASHLAVEAFHRSGRVDQYMIHTIEMVGSIRGICHVLSIKCYGQMNQARRSFIPDAIKELQSQGRKVVMSKAEDDHEVDALSHLMCLEWRFKEGKAKP